MIIIKTQNLCEDEILINIYGTHLPVPGTVLGTLHFISCNPEINFLTNKD